MSNRELFLNPPKNKEFSKLFCWPPDKANSQILNVDHLTTWFPLQRWTIIECSSAMKTLARLTLSHNPIAGLSIVDAPLLQHLHCDHLLQLERLEIANLPSLETLDLQFVAVSSSFIVEKTPSLKEVNLTRAILPKMTQDDAEKSVSSDEGWV